MGVFKLKAAVDQRLLLLRILNQRGLAITSALAPEPTRPPPGNRTCSADWRL